MAYQKLQNIHQFCLDYDALTYDPIIFYDQRNDKGKYRGVGHANYNTTTSKIITPTISLCFIKIQKQQDKSSNDRYIHTVIGMIVERIIYGIPLLYLSVCVFVICII